MTSFDRRDDDDDEDEEEEEATHRCACVRTGVPRIGDNAVLVVVVVVDNMYLY